MHDRYYRILPFDSGAYARGLMHPPMHHDIPLSEFELGVAANAPMKLIKMFYGSERNYFDKFPAADALSEEESWDHLEVDAYNQLIRNRLNSRSDDRVSAIEIQMKSDIELRNRISAVILPSGYLDKKNIREQIKSWSATAIPYHLAKEFSPLELYGLVESLVREYLVECKLI
jgi:hypothetical protein